MRDPIGLGMNGPRAASRPASAGPSDASKLLQFASASKVKGGLSGAIGSAAATGVGPVTAARMSSQSRLGTGKFSSASHSSVWPQQPPKAFSSDRRNTPAGAGVGAASSGARSVELGIDDGSSAAASAASGSVTAEGTHGSGAVSQRTRGSIGVAPPDATVVRRSNEQKAHSAERLNMDNQQLVSRPGHCPITLGMLCDWSPHGDRIYVRLDVGELSAFSRRGKTTLAELPI